MSTDDPKTHLPELLNRVEAMIDSGAGTIGELAKFLLPDQKPAQSTVRVSEWIRSRVKSPNGETALRMRDWASQKTIEIAGKRAETTAYKKAFKEVTNRRKQKATA